MKSFTFTDLNGISHCLSPSFFSANTYIDGLCFLYPVSDYVRTDLAEYARKAYRYMSVRRGGLSLRRDFYKALADKISFLASCGFPGTPLWEVLDAFGNAHSLQPVYRHHVAFCLGYVPVADRPCPPLEFYCGTFGGGFAFYTEFSTRYRLRHLLLLSSWWFSNGDVLEGYSESKMSLFKRFCKYGDLSIGD